MKNNLFDDEPIMKNCIINKLKIKAMINTNSTNYCFIDRLIAQRICEMIEIEFIKLRKPKQVKIYDDHQKRFIIHVIYSKLRVESHRENTTFMFIIDLNQQICILGKP